MSDRVRTSLIKQLAELMARVSGYQGRLVFDASMPDGTPRKLLDVSRLASLGWRPKIGLEEGIRSTYEWFIPERNISSCRACAVAQFTYGSTFILFIVRKQ